MNIALLEATSATAESYDENAFGRLALRYCTSGIVLSPESEKK